MGKKPLCFKQYSKQSFLYPEVCELCHIVDACEKAEINERKKKYLVAREKVLTMLLALFGVLTFLQYYPIAVFLGMFVMMYCYVMYKKGLHVNWETSRIKMTK
ncbi:MAG: hypothetical protein HY929_03605 [Euryarchaeota archaeon]|nr:hypothetical protein [Euryarchaeota archaeon]